MDTEMLLNGLVQLGYNFELESENDGEINIKAKETDKIISVQYYPTQGKCDFTIVASIIATKTVAENEIYSLMRELSYHSGIWNYFPINSYNDYIITYKCTLSENPLKSAKIVIGTFNCYFEDVVKLFGSQNGLRPSPDPT